MGLSLDKASQTLAMEFIMRPMPSQIISTGDGMGRLFVHASNHSTSLWLEIALGVRSLKRCVQIDEGENDGNCKESG
ncbi:hypothetical protein [Comamonas sp. CMM02]|nr:hypothetical protein [Comamonas sp. CMM02]MBD9400727.1 hypothetical protein [Comamonas sp. CMM02]